MRLLKFLFKGEVIFAGFLLSSVFKSIFTSIPVDLTVAFMGLSIFIGTSRLFKNQTIDKRAIVPNKTITTTSQ